MPRLEAVPVSSATKRKVEAGDEEEEKTDDSGSSAQVLCLHVSMAEVQIVTVDFDYYNLNPDIDQCAPYAR